MTAIRAASTVVLLREREQVELLMVRRSPALAVSGGAWAFPGGSLDRSDGELGSLEAFRAAAARELEEEVGLTLDAAQLVPWARMVSPPDSPRRFDTLYFVGAGDGDARPDGNEIIDACWLSARDALHAHESGRWLLPPPTWVALWWLERLPLAQLLQPRHRLPRAREPRRVGAPEGHWVLYEEDAGYTSGVLDAPGRRHRLLVPRPIGERPRLPSQPPEPARKTTTQTLVNSSKGSSPIPETAGASRQRVAFEYVQEPDISASEFFGS